MLVLAPAIYWQETEDVAFHSKSAINSGTHQASVGPRGAGSTGQEVLAPEVFPRALVVSLPWGPSELSIWAIN